MIQFAVRLALKAAAFMILLPHVQGIQFNGGLASALGLAVFFSFMLWAVEALVLFLATVLTVSTFGLALVIIVPLWLLGSWLLPAVALKLVADFMPNTLTVTGWIPAILGGLVLMIIGTVTGDTKRLQSIKNRGNA
jgi:uncharacterized membrane protein YvlD (DUF360 family)